MIKTPASWLFTTKWRVGAKLRVGSLWKAQWKGQKKRRRDFIHCCLDIQWSKGCVSHLQAHPTKYVYAVIYLYTELPLCDCISRFIGRIWINSHLSSTPCYVRDLLQCTEILKLGFMELKTNEVQSWNRNEAVWFVSYILRGPPKH